MRSGASDGASGIGAAKTARIRSIHNVCAASHGGERKAPGQALCHGHHISLDAGVLEPEHFPSASKTRLNFIGNQQDTVLVAQRPKRAQEIERSDIEAALPLYWLDNDCGDARWVGGVFEQGL